MILQELHRLAREQNLIGDPDFEPKPVRWTIVLDEKGTITSIICTDTTPPATEGSKKKPRPQPMRINVPWRVLRGNPILPDFLVDKPMYALGWEPGGDARRQARAEEAVKAFAELVNACARDTEDPAVLAVAAFLQRRMEHDVHWVENQFHGHDFQNNDLCAFKVGDPRAQFVHDRKAVRAWWKAHRARQRGGDFPLDPDACATCLITGVPVASSSLVPQVKIRGGQSSGAALVSFNAPAFTSYGLEGSDNAPVSSLAAETAITALRRLLARDSEAQDANGDPLPAWNFTLADDTVATFWSDHSPLASAIPDIFAAIWEEAQQEKPADVRRVYASVFKGSPLNLDNPGRFRALTLSGPQGRVIVRGFIQQSVPHTIASLRRHFQDLDIVRNCPPPKERGHPEHFPLARVIAAVAGPGPATKKLEDVHKGLTQEILEAALDMNREYPRAALVRAVERWRAEIHRDDWLDADLRDARAAIVKACLNRETRIRKLSRPEIKKDMDPSNPNPAYRLGCLMAVLEALQQAALGDVNASVIDKFFGAASASPSLVFPRMIKTARSHARKAQREKGGWAYRLENLLDEIFSKIEAQGIPRALSLEEQGLFGIGYHHMRHWLRMTKEERAAWEAQYPNSPRAFLWGKTTDALPTEPALA